MCPIVQRSQRGRAAKDIDCLTTQKVVSKLSAALEPHEFMQPGFRSRHSHCVLIKPGAWRSEDTEANNFNDVYGAWSRADNFSRSPLHQLEIAGRYKPRTHCLRSGG